MNVQLRTEASSYLVFEPIRITVELANQTARDLTVGGPQAVAHLSFSVRYRQSQRIRRYEPEKGFPPITVPARTTIQTNINLLAYYDMRRVGDYTVQAVIHWGNDTFFSNNTYIDIQQGTPLASVTTEHEPDRTMRTFSLESINRRGTQQVFLRIEDDARCYAVLPLGRIIKLHPPTMQTDQNGDVHILFQSGPDTYLRYQVRPDGAIVKRERLASGRGPVEFERDSSGRLSVPRR